MATTLYRCKTPTNLLCPCGRVARRLQWAGIDFDQVRVSVLKRDREEIGDLTGQRWVPVLVHGEDVIHDSKRIIQYVEGLDRPAERDRAVSPAVGSTRRGAR
ncbi:MAG TPA: glutathione S-transferase N-terminal domain-containing protein [Thermoleophilaceae bacterium]|nr:glutathione S-transferase N-terminal domain-containing protein [Thermoleophilaceae bacterium]